jgi:hypothetical protein
MSRNAVFAVALGLCACTSRGEDEIASKTTQPFTSASAVLADFEFEARIIAPTDDPPVVRRLLETQLMYTIGQLNGDRSVARLDRAQFAGKTLGTVPGDPPQFELTYQVKLPVAWGGGPLPPSYAFTLPLRVGEADQAAFATKYMATCTDPEGGIVDAVKDSGRMFLFYRPQLAGCSPSPADVFHATATVTLSTENTTGRFPEYHRIWEDHVLDFVAVFGREHEAGGAPNGAEDAGEGAFNAFVTLADAHLAELQPAADKRTKSTDANVAKASPNVRLSAELDDGRKVNVDAILTRPHVREESPTFGAWYDAHTPAADVVFYAGHAGLGENVRALAKKGVFTPGKYAVHVLNGCDTFAYLDPTLDTRRGGARNLDLVTNVLGGWFHTGDETAGRFLRAMTGALSVATAPQTYREIAEGVDPSQVMVVTGEEDNVFTPGMIPAAPKSAEAPGPSAEAPTPGTPPTSPTPAPVAPARASTGDGDSGGCTMTPPGGARHVLPVLFGLIVTLALTRNRRASH